MGKRIEELRKLDLDTPIERQVEALDTSVTDLREQPWYQFIGTIDDLLAQEQYGWAEDTLTGIRETVEKTQRVSPGQQRAVENIESNASRRYQGWYGRRR